MQLTLFAEERRPSRFELAREREAKHRAEMDRRRFDRESKQRDRMAGEASCCLYWIPQRSGWRTCPGCQRPLTFS